MKPINFVDANGEAQGLYPDLLRHYAEGKELNFNFVPIDWADGLDQLQTEKIDIMISVAYTPERDEIMDFNSISVVDIWSQIFVCNSNKLNSFSQLHGQHVGILTNDQHGTNFKQTAEYLGVQTIVHPYASFPDIFAAIQSKEIDAGVAPNSYGLSHAHAYNLRGTDIQFSPLALFLATKENRLHDFLTNFDQQLMVWKKTQNSFYYQRMHYWLLNTANHPDNTPFWIWIAIAFAMVISIILVCMNQLLKYRIQRRTQDLHASNEQLLTTLRSIGDAVITTDINGIITDLNPVAENLTGWSRKEALARPLKDIFFIIHEDSRQLIQSPVEHVLRSGVPIGLTNDTVLIKKDGSEIPIATNGAPIRDHNAIISGVVLVFRDQTKEHDAAQKLKNSRQRLLSMVENSPTGIIDWNMEGTILSWNKAAETIFGYTAHEAIGQSFPLILQESDTNTIQAMFSDLQTQQGGSQSTNYNQTKSGELIFCNWCNSTLKDPYGHPIGIVSFVSDITEKQQMKEAIDQRVLALTQPLGDVAEISFDTLFDRKKIQEFQDEFSAVSEVASIITLPDGTPITQPSHFTDLCQNIIRKTEKGCANCKKSDQMLDQKNKTEGYAISPCLSAGLWDASVPLMVSGKHIANWLIGQVRNETQDLESMRAYAREIGANETAFMDAFMKVPVMSEARLKQISHALSVLVTQVSNSAYQNLQQARLIASQQKAENELYQLSTAIEQSAETVVIADLLGNIEYVNPAFEQISGYSKEEALHQNMRLFSKKSHDEEFVNELLATISSGKTWEGRVTNERKNGEIYIEEVTISPVRNAAGKIKNYVAVKRDITKELQQEEALRQAQKMEAIGHLAGGIAHDFNNILQAVQGFSELLMFSLEKKSVEHDNANEIHKAAHRATKLTRQLLTFSRKEPLNTEKLNLNKVIHDSEALMAVLFGESIELMLNLAHSLPDIHADYGQLSQVVINLAVNARDAITGKGSLTISTQATTLTNDNNQKIADAYPGSFVCVSFVDTGCGMTEDIVEHIFDPFFSTKDVGKGTGLGLSVVYGIMKQNKGCIQVLSEIGKGTRFSLYFPIDPNPLQQQQENTHGQNINY